MGSLTEPPPERRSVDPRLLALARAIDDLDRRVGEMEESRLRVEKVAQRLWELEGRVESSSSGPPRSPGDRSRLVESWREFTAEAVAARDWDVVAWLDRLKDSGEIVAVEALAKSLADSLPEGESSLRSGVREILGPVRLLLMRTQRLVRVRELVEDSTASARSVELRRLETLLEVLRWTELGVATLVFEPLDWLRGDFLTLADRVLRAAVGQGDGGDMSRARELVCSALAAADLSPVEVQPRVTLFDERYHEAVSWAFEPGLPDQVIVAVVQLGLLEMDPNYASSRVYRRALVVVNRIR